MTTPIQQDYLISHIIDKITDFLIADFQLDIPSALNVVYTSDTFRILSNKDVVICNSTAFFNLSFEIKKSVI